MKSELERLELVTVKCWCGLWHAVPKSLRDLQLRQHRDGESMQGIHCPIGHVWILSGESRAKALERDLAAERARHDQTKAELAEKQRALLSERTEAKRQRARSRCGVCPCCNRSFTKLAAHMKSKHPDYSAVTP